MKKILCLVISMAALLSSVSALAEEFSIHSGVMFGMSADEIRMLEDNAGFEIVEISENDVILDTIGEDESITNIEGKIAGIDDSSIYYITNNDSGLFSAQYNFRSKNYDQVVADYPIIQQALENKYGPSTDMWASICLYDLNYRPFDTLKITATWGPVGLKDFDTWEIQLEDGSYIIIIHYISSLTLSNSTSYFHQIGYQRFEEDEISVILNELQENQSQLNEDL